MKYPSITVENSKVDMAVYPKKGIAKTYHPLLILQLLIHKYLKANIKIIIKKIKVPAALHLFL